ARAHHRALPSFPTRRSSDLDQRRQIEGYCLSRGWEVAAEFVEPGNTATDDRRPAFQAMIDAAMQKPSPFNVILVHSFSRFFRDRSEEHTSELQSRRDLVCRL